ncbi:MAG TPA: hypothetical protein VMS14_08725, partial [Ilumatobacteraceae bacterium]|nr:hypothetical protein [Ilumatobacteraceae bacterium]
MSDHLDVIEAMRRVDPVQRGSIDEAQCATAAELRARLRERIAIMPTTLSNDQRLRAGRLPWWKVAAAIAVVGSAVAAAVLLVGSDDGDLRPATPVTDPATSVSQPTGTTESTTVAGA